MDATTEVKQAAKSAFTVRNILILIFGLFVLNIILEVVGMFFPAAAGFFQSPVSTVRRLFSRGSPPQT